MHRRLLRTFSRSKSQENGGGKGISDGDSPEDSAARGVRLFCESGGPNNSGEEVLHLPTIVEAAESSPAAATEAARLIRKFLSKDNNQRAYVQYNAIMLVRILADNPGKSFTKNLDTKFVNTVKELLRDGRDMSVQQILRETLDNFETAKPNDETLTGLREMWTKEKDKMTKRGSMQPAMGPNNWGPPASQGNFAAQQAQQQNYFSRPHRQRNTLPPPAELAQRIEEARTSAKLLSQVVATTPPTEMLNNELIKEFVERCQSASRSVQAYIHADNPPPDEDTLLTLIETNDLLASSLSKHQRALLEARKRMGASPQPNPANVTGPYEAPTDFAAASYGPSPGPGKAQFSAPLGPPPGRKPVEENQDPFGDHNEAADLQVPLSPQNFGLPPEGVVQQPDGAAGRDSGYPENLDMNRAETNGGSRDAGAQPAKPRYRF